MNESAEATESSQQPPGALSGHDVFQTPENEKFYSANLYNDLDATSKEIRIINILPDSGGGLIECEFLPEAPLVDVKGRYFALSYCAGNAKTTNIILVNGIRCNVFANLHHALVLARQYFNKSFGNSPLRLWVDQLCINQKNNQERSHQVGFMRDIYECAQHTLICLSISDTRGTGLEWLSELCRNLPLREDDNMPSFENDEERENLDAEMKRKQNQWHHDAYYIETILMCPEDPKPTVKRFWWYRLNRYFWENMANERFANGWMAFYDVLGSPWWGRAWVFQEFIMSHNITFMFGRQFISWAQISQMLDCFCEIHESFLTSRDRLIGTNGLEINGPEDRVFCRVLEHIQRTGAQENVDRAGVMTKMKLRWNGRTDIKMLLAHSRYCESSDDRDRVYSFIGLAYPKYHIIPDYSSQNSPSDVLIETTKKIIQAEDSLDVLIQAAIPVASRRLALPSWVVDWTCRGRDDYFGKFSLKMRCGITHTSANASFREIIDSMNLHRTLVIEVWGIHVDTIRSIIRNEPFGNFETPQGYGGNSLSSAERGDEIWILYGLRIPIILRPESNGYRIVSCALVNDSPGWDGLPIVALGEIMELAETGQRTRKRISIF
jgi:hypothetical protein